MNESLPQSYTNEVTADYLKTLDKSPFTAEQLAGFSDEGRALILQPQAYQIAHPPTQSSWTFKLDDGKEVRAAHKGDYVMYADGTTAQIVTSAGEDNSDVALVGSRLSNGDEIIDTLQRFGLWVERDGVPMPEGFLPAFDS